jgi:hypothetical protein
MLARTRRPHLALLVGAAFAALLCLAPSAPAHHATSASAQLSVDPPAASCTLVDKKPRTRCDGSRVVRVAWSVSCGYEPAITITYWGKRPNGGRFALDSVEIMEAVTSGVVARRIEAGVTVFATVEVSCYTPGDGETIDSHDVRAESSPTAQAFIAPRLKKATPVTNSFCGIRVNERQLTTLLQAGETSGIDFDVLFDAQSMLGVRARSAAGMRQVTIHARGAGLRYKRAARTSVPGPIGPIPVSFGARITPRKGGNLKVWATVAGAKTNVLTFRVAPKRC